MPEAVGSDDGLAQGTTVIAIPVPRSEIPADDLETGDRLVLYRTPASSGGEAAAEAEVMGEGPCSRSATTTRAAPTSASR